MGNVLASRQLAGAAVVWLALTLAPAACAPPNSAQPTDGGDEDAAAATDEDACGVESPDAAPPDPDAAETPVWTFVSYPDFLNADIGDVSALTALRNSTNPAYETAIAYVLDTMAAENPDFVMVAGDLVNGHWYADADGVQVFGPVGTLEEKAAAVTTAADLYYSQWKERFAARGLPVYAAVGDHDIGDNDWAAGSAKAFLVPTYKEQWAKQFTLDASGAPLYDARPVGTPFEHTAYAVRHKNVLIVTVDVFRQTDPTMTIDSRTGSVRADVVDGQLAWLDAVLAGAADDPAIDHVIVQGHVPVLVPVRQMSSSGLTMPGAGESLFWQTLAQRKVDLYFAGEVHDMTASNHLGVEQVAHGGIIGNAPRISYLVGRVYPDRLELELKSADIVVPGGSTARLWQAGSNRPREMIAVASPGFVSVGTLVIDKSSGATQYLNRTGYFIPLGQPPPPTDGLAVHLPLDEQSGTTAVNRGNTGAANNGALTGATFVPGKLGNGLLFDAADRVVAGSSPALGAQARTTSVWVRLAAPGSLRTMFTFGSNQSGGKWDTDIDATGVYEVGVGQGRVDGSGGLSLADNEWHQVVSVLPEGANNLTALRMYVDGNAIAFTAPSTTVNTLLGPFVLGHSANSQSFQQFAGTLDDVAVWGDALTPAEVRALHDLGDDATLAYDAGEVDTLFASFAAAQDVTIGGRLWLYQPGGLTGAPGQLVHDGASYAINLGGGAGFTSP
jgi:hypothetical protein